MGTASPAHAASARDPLADAHCITRAEFTRRVAARVIAESILDRPKTTRAPSRLTMAAGASRIDFRPRPNRLATPGHNI